MTKAEKTKQYIVEKTAPVFNMKGYAGTSLSDITAATGLTKGSIYGNFANKDEIALAVYDYNVGILNRGLNSVVAESATATDKLLLMANFYRSQMKQTLTMGGCPIFNTAIDADDTHPALKAKAAKSLKDWKKSIESIIKKGIAAGEINPVVNAALFATEFIAIIEGGIMLAKVTGDISMLNTCISRVESIINNELKP
ncbi:TetR/AcrR family transcriptional regulator [Segetibacter sp. 3557_3]|uniref:TetR/AcrR family transcriptional regulator n=1 Tax=Segetibacter sp. 3557_3 TaxID=2547429 RepID=UPI001058C71E|nr:TetR/AcrR family transcriptional regulator [Segetibacter sp. 3557_3]TDH28636.1 TetR/AcrR family transcriptional regulator [Segetibacter sp. 3557_3]